MDDEYQNKQPRIDSRESDPPSPQLIHWAVDDGKPPGICIDEPDRGFVAWLDLKKETEEKLLPQAIRVLPLGSTITTADFHGRKNHQVMILDPNNEIIGRVWFGKDPYKGWAYDGLIRIGNALTDYEAVVWQIYQRYSDGTYRRIVALDGQQTNLNRQWGFPRS